MTDPRSPEVLDAVEKINAKWHDSCYACDRIAWSDAQWVFGRLLPRVAGLRVMEDGAIPITPDEILELAKQIQEQEK